MCNLLLKHNANIPFLKHITMDDEKWILYMRSAGKRHELLNLQPIIEANGIESLLLREIDLNKNFSQSDTENSS